MSSHHPARSPFHKGEHAVQQRLGVREAIEPWARKVVRPYLPEEHRTFFAELPFVVAAARDERGRPWATIVAGRPGFVASPDPRTLVVGAGLVPGDALENALRPGADVGLLGIQLETRRRNRANGRVRRRGAGELWLDIDQSFGNCPQYISQRAWQPAAQPALPAPRRAGDRLEARQRRWIGAADTLFVATGHRGEGEDWSFGMDVSHRGGPAGFVHLEDDCTLVIPDYAGNNHFNTIGNLLLDPRAGLLFVDFEGGSLLQLTGRSEIDWTEDQAARFPGAKRLIRFHLEEQIIAGRLKPRQRLVEEEIAREMSVSRSPIREALRALERDGLVTLTPGRGACVADLTPEEVDDVYAVRGRLGGLMFSLAARHITEAALDRLDQVVGEMERVVADADIQRYFLLDLDFEEQVMEACPNKKLVAIWRNLGRPILRFRYFSLYPPGRLSTSLQYHRDLVLAFRRRDGVTADQLVQRTIEAAGRALRDHLRSGVA